jgi:hypothetical protein
MSTHARFFRPGFSITIHRTTEIAITQNRLLDQRGCLGRSDESNHYRQIDIKVRKENDLAISGWACAALLDIAIIFYA